MPFVVQKIAGQQSMIDYVSVEVLRIGRGTNAELRLDDVAVALEHAAIEPVEGGYRLLDRGSATGTYLNGKPVREARLSANDLINIGGYQIRVQITDPEDPLFLSVRASAPMAAPPAGTMAAPPRVIAAAVQAAVAREAAEREAAAREVVSSESVTAADAATVRMSPEALAAALRAATAMAAAADRAAAAPVAGAAAGPPSPPSPPSSAAPSSSSSPPPPPQRPLPQLPAAPPSRQPPSAPPALQRSSAPPALRAPVVDYLRAYGLRRPLFNKGLLALVLTAGAAAALVFLARTGRATAFEPGRVHAWHAETACTSCHSPWRGPDPALCSDCHARQREKGEIHQARQTFTPPCTGCHPEHRGGDRVSVADDAQCASCHRDLRVDPPAAEPRFARRVSAFFDDHPDFSVTLPSGVRLPLAEAVATRADPTPLRFNHQRHLRAGLPTPSGQRVQLQCQSCHHLSAGANGAAGTAGSINAAATAAGLASQPGGGQPGTPGGAAPGSQNAAAGGPTGIVPISYETGCTTSGCHPLTFDNRRPDQVAPHASPRRVREFLVSVYSDRRGAGESVGEQYRRLIRGAGAPPRGIDYGGQAQAAVVLAERYLYGTACKECHVVDTNARPLPRVTWTPIPARWLPNGRFQHLDHPYDCRQCHAAVATSTAAADVLLPSIAICRTCHGGGSGAAQVKAGTAPAAPTGCLSCHRYHPNSQNPAQAAQGSPAPPPAEAPPPAAPA